MSFGEELRRERELRQISLREISNATKIDVARLEALERNDFSCLPGGLYNRGYVRAYCEHIGIDSESMVNAYLLEAQTQAANGGSSEPGLLRGRTPPSTLAANEPAAESARAEGGRRWLIASVLAAALLIVAVLAGWWLLGGRV